MSLVQDEAMNTILRKVIRVHEAKTANGKFQVAHIKLLIAGVQMVQYVLSTTMRRDMIVKSFAITGQYDPKNVVIYLHIRSYVLCTLRYIPRKPIIIP